MWELDCDELCWRGLFESPLDSKEIKLFSLKGNQPWIFTGSTVAEAKTPILRSTYVKNWLIGKDPDAGKDWRQKEKGKARMSWLDNITDSMDLNLSKLLDIVKDRGAWHAAAREVTKCWKRLSIITTTTTFLCNKTTQPLPEALCSFFNHRSSLISNKTKSQYKFILTGQTFYFIF